MTLPFPTAAPAGTASSSLELVALPDCPRVGAQLATTPWKSEKEDRVSFFQASVLEAKGHRHSRHYVLLWSRMTFFHIALVATLLFIAVLFEHIVAPFDCS